MPEDRALSDAIAALAKSQLLTVDVLRQTQSSTIAMAESLRSAVATLGQICDQNAEILRQVETSNARWESKHRDSERNMRVVQSQMKDVQARLQPIEADFQARRASTR
jgi:hypothetical protein